MKHLNTDGWDEVPSPHTHRPSFFVPRLTLEKISKWTWLMLSSESEIRHSSVMLSPSRIGSVGPLMSKVAACGQRLKMCYWSQHESAGGSGRGGGSLWRVRAGRQADLHLGGKCGCWSGQHFQNKALPFPAICFRLLLGKLPILSKSPATGSSTLVTPTGAFCRKYLHNHKHFA